MAHSQAGKIFLPRFEIVCLTSRYKNSFLPFDVHMHPSTYSVTKYKIVVGLDVYSEKEMKEIAPKIKIF
jgi:hypothetical protein